MVFGAIAAVFLMLSTATAVPNIEKNNIENKIENLKNMYLEKVNSNGLRRIIGLIIFWTGWIIGMIGSFFSPKFFWIGYGIAMLGVLIGDLQDMPIDEYFPNAAQN